MDEARIAPTEAPEPTSRSTVKRLREAVGFALGGAVPGDDVALAWACASLPLIGFALGSLARVVVRLLGDTLPAVALAGSGALALWLGGGRGFAATAAAGRSQPAGRIAGLVVLVVEAALLHAVGADGSLALPLAAMLGRWALVIVAYGSTPLAGDPLATRLVRAARFREFGIASVSAMAATLLLIDAIGLLLLFAIATAALALRIAAHSRHGGISQPVLGAAPVLGEITTLLCCALVASAHQAVGGSA